MRIFPCVSFLLLAASTPALASVAVNAPAPGTTVYSPVPQIAVNADNYNPCLPAGGVPTMPAAEHGAIAGPISHRGGVAEEFSAG